MALTLMPEDRAAAILAMRRSLEAQELLAEAGRLLARARRARGSEEVDRLLERARSLRERSEATRSSCRRPGQHKLLR
jgi:hypothetical protein